MHWCFAWNASLISAKKNALNFAFIGSASSLPRYPDDASIRSGGSIAHEIEMVSNFSELRVLELSCDGLNGKYPSLFNFRHLQELTVSRCSKLKWDLSALEGMPLISLDITWCASLTGNMSSLGVLKNTLETVRIRSCAQVKGTFMALADFPHLKVLKLPCNSSVTGDVRHIRENDFPKLEELYLPESVYGGDRNEFMRLSDGKDLISAIYSIKNQPHRHPSLFEDFNWYLNADSPEWYQEEFAYPFSCCLVRAGSRLGWRWERKFDYTPDYCFEVNWLDPMPTKGSMEYDNFIHDLQIIQNELNRFPFFRGYHNPPSEKVFNRLSRQYVMSMEELEIYNSL